MTRPRIIILVLLAAALLLPATAIADELDGEPVVTPQPIQVNAGETFDLEVSVQAFHNATYTMSFGNRTRFSYPGSKNVSYEMEVNDAILFKVKCSVADDAPDGDFDIPFTLEWDKNGTLKSVESTVRVKVGEGAKTEENPCESIMLVAPLAIVSFSVLLVRRRAPALRE